MVYFDENATDEGASPPGLFNEPDMRDSDGDDPELALYRPNRMRGRVVDRLTYTGRALARHRVEQWRIRRRIGPHAITFFYVDQRSEGSRQEELVVATRMFLDESDEDYAVDAANAEADGVPELLLIKILGALHDLALEYQRTTGFDPRVQMVQRVEPMRADAEYLGVGATSVTFPDGLDAIPMMQGMVVLSDGTQMLLEGGYGLEPPRVQSTHTLDIGGLLGSRRWRWALGGQFQGASQGVQLALPALAALHQVTSESHASGGVSSGTGRRRRMLSPPRSA
jgi:hypothetical protein